MIMFDDKKSTIGAILGSGPSGKLAERKEDEDKDAEKHIAAEDLISAVHSRDSKGVAAAFQALWSMHNTAESYEPEDC